MQRVQTGAHGAGTTGAKQVEEALGKARSEAWGGLSRDLCGTFSQRAMLPSVGVDETCRMR